MPPKEAIGAVAVAALLVLAGCSSAVPGSTTHAQSPTDETVDGETAATDAADLTFYVSDRPGAIEDFEHLNVTITKLGLHRVGDGADDGDDANETEREDDTETEDDDGPKAGWVTRDVDAETVDLTKLQGANATAISNVSVPAGEYDKVFVYVSEVNATLENGESANVKLPSSKLQITKPFAVAANDSPAFVFDINVHKAGNSGKYILRPIVSESGTGDQVEIEKVDENGKPENPGNSGASGDDDDDADDEERSLEASLDGAVRTGETVTLSVTDANGPVANATVELNGETVGETDVDGTLAFEVPDTEELEVEVTVGDAEVELEREVKGGNGNGGGNDGGYGSVQQLSGHALAAV